MIHTSITRNCIVFLFCRYFTRSAILWSQKFDSTKWLTVFLRDEGKLCNFEACCVDHYIYLEPFAFHNEQFQMLYKDQLDRS